MGISSWLAFSSRLILFFKRSFAAWSFLGSTFFFFLRGSALMGMSSQKENNEARWWVSLICVCQVPRSQLPERRARAEALSAATAMAPLAADRLLPGAHSWLSVPPCAAQRSGLPVAPRSRVPAEEGWIAPGPPPTWPRPARPDGARASSERLAPRVTSSFPPMFAAESLPRLRARPRQWFP